MSETDSFIEEVTEEVRRDRMYAIWRRYGPFVIGALALLVAIAAFLQWQDHRTETLARERGTVFLQALEIEDPVDRAEALRAAADGFDGGLAALTRMRAAADLAEAGEVERAIAEYAAAADGAPILHADLARLKSLQLQAETLSPAALLGAVAPLTIEGAPWRYLALELEAAAHLRADDRDAAREALQVIIDAEDAPVQVRARAEELSEAL